MDPPLTCTAAGKKLGAELGGWEAESLGGWSQLLDSAAAEVVLRVRERSSVLLSAANS